MKRRLIAAALSGTMILGLTGCMMVEDSARAPFPVQLEDGHLRIMSCTTGRVIGLEVTKRKRSSQERETILDIQSFDIGLEYNQLMSERAIEAGTVVTNAPVEFSPGDEILVGVSKAPGATAYAAFTVPESGLPAESWLQPDGKLTEYACSLYPSSGPPE